MHFEAVQSMEERSSIAARLNIGTGRYQPGSPATGRMLNEALN